MNLKGLVKNFLTELENRKYEKLLETRQTTYQEWCSVREEAGCPGADQDIRIFASDRGVLAAGAVRRLEAYFREHPQAQVVYGDEDVWENFPEGKRYMPWFKPDWSPDLFLDSFYFGNVVAVRPGLYERARRELRGEAESGWNQEGREAAPEVPEQIVRRCVELAGGYRAGCKAIGHLSEILFHCDSEESILRGCEGRTMSGREAPLEEVSEEKQSSAGMVSVIIPSRDQPEILSSCLQAIRRTAENAFPLEIIVVDNGSGGENRKKIEALLEHFHAKYIFRPMEFHFSEMCNLGAENAAGDFLLFLNDDVELCVPGSIERMYRLAGRSFTGAVGMKLYYPHSMKIQHAGITNLPMGPVHKLQFMDDDVSYYFGANRGNRNVLAVTAACLMVEKRKFREAGGFSEKLRVAFNDVALCFRLWELGYSNVCMNDIYAYHHESLSRGSDEAVEKRKRLLEERKILYRMYPALEGRDPYYSIHLNTQGLDTRIRPSYETAGNILQECRRGAKEKEFAGYRQDGCLLVRVEAEQAGEICGYCVVLGDNNACYEKMLLFRREDTGESVPAQRYRAVSIEGQYRPDLTENMPDQKNTGLCGFRIKTDTLRLPEGSYRVGAAARNRITGIRLINWSNFCIQV